MRLIGRNNASMNLGEALKQFLEGSQKVSGCGQWPDAAKHLAVAGFIAGAEWASSNPKPKEEILKECQNGHELFNKIKEG